MPRKLALSAQDCAYITDYLRQAKIGIFVEPTNEFKEDTLRKITEAQESEHLELAANLLGLRLTQEGKKKLLSSLRASRYRNSHEQSTIKVSARIFNEWSKEKKKYAGKNKTANADDFMICLIENWRKKTN